MTQDIHEIARQLAADLSDTRSGEEWCWHQDENYSQGEPHRFARLTNGDGWTFYLEPSSAGSFDGSLRRIVFRCEWPRCKGEVFMPTGDEAAARITVSARKKPHLIAEDVARRFLPKAKEQLAAAWQTLHEAEDEWRQRQSILRRLLKFPGVSEVKLDSRRLRAKVPYGEAEVLWQDYVKMRLELPAPVAYNLLRELGASHEYMSGWEAGE